MTVLLGDVWACIFHLLCLQVQSTRTFQTFFLPWLKILPGRSYLLVNYIYTMNANLKVVAIHKVETRTCFPIFSLVKRFLINSECNIRWNWKAYLCQKGRFNTLIKLLIVGTPENKAVQLLYLCTDNFSNEGILVFCPLLRSVQFLGQKSLGPLEKSLEIPHVFSPN
jgi:hypothetical protein